MTNEQKLILLKQNLQMLTTANDEYLSHLLELAEQLIMREGIQMEDSTEYSGIQIQYAAYLFRKRASDETVMPRFLRWELNNLLVSQKGRI